ncbi:hypothetical protein HY991_03680 [Candidatus Micrarchaeota archaeon]|nr:hypothetical protein [Candidatus Micrarchaeota archaeon]
MEEVKMGIHPLISSRIWKLNRRIESLENRMIENRRFANILNAHKDPILHGETPDVGGAIQTQLAKLVQNLRKHKAVNNDSGRIFLEERIRKLRQTADEHERLIAALNREKAKLLDKLKKGLFPVR